MGAPIWPAPTKATRTGLLGRGVDAVGLDLGVLLEALDAVLTTDTAGLVAAEGGVGPVGDPAVDADGAGAEPTTDRERPLLVAGGDVAAETVLVVVGEADRFVVAVERDDDEHGAEDLLARDGHVVGHVGEQRRLHEPALVELLGATTTGDDARALGLALLDVAEHALALLLAHERAHEVAHVVGVAVGEALEARRRDLDRLVVDLAVDEHAGGHHATLTAVHRDHARHAHLRLEIR